MNSLTDLRELVDVVIGVDTHVHTHSAAVIDSATGGVLGEVTVEATAAGYAELVEFANNYPRLRAWAIEGTGGHGAGLSRHLLESCELVVELDRPKRAARRNGAKSDPLDAIRAAREAMARPRLGTPRSGGERQALSVLLTARRSAINASTEAQLQVFSLVIAAPEPIRVHSEAAFAMLAGVAPIPANSVQVTTRYRLNRYGDRHLNTALHTVVQSRIQYQPAIRDYVARRTAEGKTSREIKRCLARYVARDLYRLLESRSPAA
jgi:transposase